MQLLPFDTRGTAARLEELSDNLPGLRGRDEIVPGYLGVTRVEKEKNNSALRLTTADGNETGLGRVRLRALDTDKALVQANPDSDLVTMDIDGNNDGMPGGATRGDLVERLVKLMARRNRRPEALFLTIALSR